MIGSLRRTKMVSFRLSIEEYTAIRAICESRGIRSISDLARMAMQNMATSADRPDPLWHEMGILRSQIHVLSLELDRLTRVLEARQTTCEADTSLDPAHGRS
jgi:hypothetical protein